MSGKRYPDEFKIEAVKQVTDRGHSATTGGRPANCAKPCANSRQSDR